MLNIRTVILSVGLVVILMLAVPLVTARTEVVSHPSRGPVSWLDIQKAYVEQNTAPIPSYRDRLDECFDVPIREHVACRSAGQTPVQSNRSALDKCLGVSNIPELAGCRNASPVPVPSYRSSLDECSDVGLIYRAQCLSENQHSTS